MEKCIKSSSNNNKKSIWKKNPRNQQDYLPRGFLYYNQVITLRQVNANLVTIIDNKLENFTC